MYGTLGPERMVWDEEAYETMREHERKKEKRNSKKKKDSKKK